MFCLFVFLPGVVVVVVGSREVFGVDERKSMPTLLRDDLG